MDILSTIIVSLLTSIIAMHIHMKLLENRLIKFLDTQEKDSRDYLNKVEEIVMEVLRNKEGIWPSMVLKVIQGLVKMRYRYFWKKNWIDCLENGLRNYRRRLWKKLITIT